MRPRQNPSKCFKKPHAQHINPRDIANMDALHRDMGFTVLPSRISDKPEPMRIGGQPGPKRRKHPYAPA